MLVSTELPARFRRGVVLSGGFLCALLCAASVAAQTSPGPGSVSGYVLNVHTREPVGGAQVRMLCLYLAGRPGCEKERSVLANADGAFRFESIPAGSFMFLAQAKGLIQISGSVASVVVHPGESINDVQVGLTSPGVIAGKVIDERERPERDIGIVAFKEEMGIRGVRLREVAHTTTNDNGEYRLDALWAGKYYVAAQVVLPAKAKGASRPISIYYPSALDIDHAVFLSVAPGSNFASIVVHLQQVAAFRISGKVSGLSDSQKNGRLTLHLAPRNAIMPGGFSDSFSLKPDASFEMDNVIPGSYLLRLMEVHSIPGTPGELKAMKQHLLAQEYVDVSANDVDGLVLMAPPPPIVTGRIRLEEGAVLAMEKMHIALDPVASAQGLGDPKTVDVGKDGAFIFSNCDPLPYLVEFNLPAGLYARSVTFNQQDVSAGVVDLSSGSGGDLEIRVRAGTATISGTVQGIPDGLPASGGEPGASSPVVSIFLIPSKFRADSLSRLLRTQARNGDFTLQNVPPGDYFAVALYPTGEAIWGSDEFVDEMQRLGQRITVEENDRLRITVPFINADQFADIVTRLGL